MTKVVSALFLIAMLIQVVRPLGLPGLRKRSDFWKLAIAALFIISVTALVRPH